MGGLRHAAWGVNRVPGCKLKEHKLSEITDDVVSEFENELDKVLSCFSESCEFLQELDQQFRFEGVRFDAGTGWTGSRNFRNSYFSFIRVKVPVGITAPIEPGGVFPIVSSECWQRKNRARYLHRQHELRQLQ